MKQKNGNRSKALLYTLSCVALWALIPVVSKLGQSDLDNHQFLFWSSLVSLLTFLALSLPKGRLASLRAWTLKDWGVVAGLGLLGTYLYYILLYFAYARARGLEVLVLQYSWPVFIVILSVPLLKEKLTARRLLAAGLGFAGVALVLSKGALASVRLDDLGVNALVLLGALSFALFSVLSKKLVHDPFALNLVYFLAATLASLGSMLVFSGFKLPSAASFPSVLVNGVFVNGVSYALWVMALREAEASFVAPLVFLTPVLAAVYLVVLFGEPLLPVYGLGLAAVVAAGLVNRESKVRKS